MSQKDEETKSKAVKEPSRGRFRLTPLSDTLLLKDKRKEGRKLVEDKKS